jgi:hypothetical protein
VVTDRLIRITTALAVLMVASVAAIISYQHAYELVATHGETGLTARLLPFTVDGLIWAASMVALDASRRNHAVPSLALCSLAAGIVAQAVRQPGARPGPRPRWRAGQRLASRGPGWLLRATYGDHLRRTVGAGRGAYCRLCP